MATCYVCHKEIVSAHDLFPATFITESGAYRRLYAHKSCDEAVAEAERKAMLSDPDFLGFDSNGMPID